jgi:S-adenosylmethionine/arginine decarboxylase-like enzyme
MQHLLPLGLSNRALIKEARRAPIYAHPRERAMFETSMRAAAFYDALKALEHAAEALESSIVELTEITRQTDEQEEKDLDADRGA